MVVSAVVLCCLGWVSVGGGGDVRPSPRLTTAASHAATATKLRHRSLALNQQQQNDDVVEKMGLEAGLFQALTNKDKQSDDGKPGVQKATDLLKRYGGAYLLTSTSLALVSFAICYAAVDNGVDVSALLKTVNIETSSTSETVGTVGIAYAVHKAASPIRFPPTVALTPIVARKLFGRTDDDVQADDPSE
jgi:hypothetical protein